MKKTRSGPRGLTGVYVLAAVTVFSIVIMMILLCIPQEPAMGEFVPPSFDSAAVQGTPEVPDSLGYISPYQDGMAYRFSVCGNVTAEGDGRAVVYLTNPSDNEVYMKLRILDAEGNVLGETGLLRPGEYVKYAMMDRVPGAGTEIKLKIMGYEPETYNSAGSVTLNTFMGR